jgi:predicted nucleotide-binding protein
VIRGITIPTNDLEQIKITRTEKDSSRILPIIRAERAQSNVIVAISDEWYVADRGEDVTDKLILAPPGSAKLSLPTQTAKMGKRIFVVHGHDEATKQELELFLKELGLDPIVLHRKPDQGRTIIEKFEKYSDVSYAFVLLTPDDVGHSKAEETNPDEKRVKELRARQNVIFEFGYFVGRLGRGRVCCLHKPGVTLPTDISGVLYKEVSGTISAIGYEIIKELKAAGFQLQLKN